MYKLYIATTGNMLRMPIINVMYVREGIVSVCVQNEAIK